MIFRMKIRYLILSIGIIGIILAFSFGLAAAILKVGESVRPFSLQTVDKTVVTVMVEEGRLTVKRNDQAGKLISIIQPEAMLLDFWATWCIPCRAAMPHLDRLYRQFRSVEGGEEKVEFFGIALDRQGEAIVRPFLQKIKLAYPQLSTPVGDAPPEFIRSPQEMASAFKVQEIPVVYIFDRQGKIVHAHVGFKESHVKEIEEAVALLLKADK